MDSDSDTDSENGGLTLREKAILDSLNTLMKNPHELTYPLRQIASKAHARLGRSATDKMPFTHFGGKNMISLRLGKPPPEMPECDELGNPMYRLGASGTTWVSSKQGDDWLFTHHIQTLKQTPPINKIKGSAAEFCNDLEIVNIRAKDTSIASVKWIWCPPEFVASNDDKIDILMSITRDTPLKNPDNQHLKNRVLEEVRFVEKLTQISALDDVMRGLTTGQKKQVYSEGYPTVQAMRAIAPLLRSDDFHFEFNKPVMGPSDNNELLKVMGIIARKARKEKWYPGDVRRAIESINYMGTVVEDVRNSFLGAWSLTVDGHDYGGCLDEHWGKHETVVMSRYTSHGKRFKWRGRMIPRQSFFFHTYGEIQIEIYGLGTATIGLFEDKIRSYRYHSRENKAVDLFCKCVALLSAHTAAEEHDYDQHPKDPFFLWNNIKIGEIVPKMEEGELTNYPGLSIGEDGVKWKLRSKDNLLMLPIRPMFPNRLIHGTDGQELVINIDRVDEQGAYTVKQVEFVEFTGPTTKVGNITFTKPNEDIDHSYKRLWENVMNPMAVAMIQDTIRQGDYQSSISNIVSRHARSGPYERAVAQEALRQRTTEAWIFFFLPHAAGETTDMRVRPGRVPMETAGYKLDVTVEQDGRITAPLQSDNWSITVGDNRIMKGNLVDDGTREVQLGFARLLEERRRAHMQEDYDEDEDINLPSYDRYLDEYPEELEEEMQMIEDDYGYIGQPDDDDL